MPIGSVGVLEIGGLAETPIVVGVGVGGVTGGEMTPTLEVGGEIGRLGLPPSTLEAATATTAIAKWVTSIVLAAHVCVSNPSIQP